MEYRVLVLLAVFSANGARELMWGTWVPYWKVESGTQKVIDKINLFNQVSPFVYEVDKSGNLVDKTKKKIDLWKKVYSECKSNSVEVIPTIFWAKPQEMHDCLSNSLALKTHTKAILDLVQENNFDGINIDYECLSPDDRPYFLLLMQDLSEQLHKNKKKLACSISAQVSDIATGIHPWNTPKKTALNKKDKIKLHDYQKKLSAACDQFHLMAYDEWGAPCLYSPIQLRNKYYLSHSSNGWVNKIIRYALTYIPANKLILCVPTYGLEFKISHVGQRRKMPTFAKSRSLGWVKAEELAAEKGQTPKRTIGGELAYTYKDDNDSLKYVCYLDEKSLFDKVKMARRYNLKGLYLFKIDGTEPDKLWPVIKK